MRKHSKPKENVARKREKGGPAIAADLLVALRLPIETRQAVLAWGKDQPGQPNLSEAIRRLIDIGLGRTPGKIPQGPSGEPDNEEKAVGAGPPTASEQPPKGTTESLTVKGAQATGEVKWTPRIVEATPPSAAARPTTTLEAQSATKPLEDNHSYQMPEDFGAFNEYWTRAQKRLGRQLTYEEVIVLFNKDRQTSKNI